MKYTIRKDGRMLGVANFPDEAKEFAVRMNGRGGDWSSTGMLHNPVDGTPTGFRVAATTLTDSTLLRMSEA